MAWHALTHGITSLIFYQGTGKPKCIGFLETFKNPVYQKIILITAGIIISLKFKTKRTEGQVCGITNINIQLIRYQFLLIILKGANHKQSSQKSQSTSGTPPPPSPPTPSLLLLRYEGIFLEKLFKTIQKKASQVTYFHEEIQTLNVKMTQLKNQKRFFHEIKSKQNLIKMSYSVNFHIGGHVFCPKFDLIPQVLQKFSVDFSI